MEACEPAFENRFTRAFGFPVEKIRTKSRDFLLPTIKAFISESPFLVMATCDPDGRCDASPKGGLPGFVRILDDRHLLVPDVAGNKLFQSYQNMDQNPHVGLVFFIPNLDRHRAMLAGAAGGVLGFLAFIGLSGLGDVAGRLSGAVILGAAIALQGERPGFVLRYDVVDGRGHNSLRRHILWHAEFHQHRGVQRQVTGYAIRKFFSK